MDKMMVKKNLEMVASLSLHIRNLMDLSAVDMRLTTHIESAVHSLANAMAVVVGDISYTGPSHFSINLEEENLIQWNEKIKAIKSYRNRTGLGLKESKDIIDKRWKEVWPIKNTCQEGRIIYE